MSATPLEAIAATLPTGFALVSKTTATRDGIVEVSYVLATRAPDSGRFGRRVANVPDLDGRVMAPFPDAPWAAVAALVAAGWVLP